MDEETEYRIEYTITRRQPGEDDFAEIGFGSSGAWSNLEACLYAVESDVGNGQWETEPGHPDTESVMTELREIRARG
jgi:hypothetical protein